MLVLVSIACLAWATKSELVAMAAAAQALPFHCNTSLVEIVPVLTSERPLILVTNVGLLDRSL